MCDYVVHGLLQRPPTTCDNHRWPARRPQAKFQEIRRAQHTLSWMRQTAHVVTVTERAAARDV